MPTVAIIRRICFRSRHLLHVLFGAGGWRLRPREQVIVDAVLDSLAPHLRELVRTQLKQNFFVDRSSERVFVLWFYERNNTLRILDREFEDRLLKVKIEVDGRTQNTHVTFYKGYIFSIEFKKPAKFYAGKKVTVRGVQARQAERKLYRGDP